MNYKKSSILPEACAKKLEHDLNRLIIPADKGKNLVLGKAPSPGDVILQSNDYLNLGHHPSVIGAQVASLLSSKNNSFMSNVFLHNDALSRKTACEMSNYTEFDHCIIAPSGWIANTALMQTICHSQTNVYIDFFTHMSLWEGARYAGANIFPFMHNNTRHLKRLIGRNGPGIVIVDSIYSTLGTIAPLIDIVAVAKNAGCATVVDESHSLGTHGPQGAGLLKHLNISADVDFMTASLAKTFAYRAGAIWCNNRFGESLPYSAYSSIFSSAMMESELERIRATLSVVKTCDQARETLFENANTLIQGLKKIGFNIRSQSQIIAIETGDSTNTINVRTYLEKHGVLGSVFCPPATPNNKNLIRLSINSGITKDQIEHVISIFRHAFNEPDLYFI
ncbi:alpha-hydroxyketone-type quorum-sensing autoinducer synthase [Vibrio genomosp. F10]|uniref:alpha-hydroxyketone-type quorum-sensing autoinducer synthase n=1 Tax=Vibrio genomosp. F10 TaxID=723171 RepID=UPI0002F50468|nr:alpha-hydroxyketone-type quorum-sensing autoinducer synthase [Vibrio genomosp. F10]OEE95579.1 CAI-1 autoinducer synthase [Vibrio genomosp. F10 str. 9ZD137]